METAQQNSGQAATEFCLPVRFQHQNIRMASVASILLRNVGRNVLSLHYDTPGVCRAVVCLFILYFNLLSLRLYYQKGRAIAEAICPWLLTEKVKLHSLVSRCGICGRQCGTEAHFSSSTSVFPSQCNSKNAPYIFNHQSPML